MFTEVNTSVLNVESVLAAIQF